MHDAPWGWTIPRRLAGTVMLILVTALGAAGCGFFDAREPTVPIDIPDDLVELPKTTPQNILINYTTAIRFDLVGLSQLERTLSQEFVLTFDIADSVELTFGSLDRTEFLEAYRLRATEEADSFHFEFPERNPTEETGNTALYDELPYTFTILTRVSPDSAVIRETYTGLADVRLATDAFGAWEITSWEDFNDGGGITSWGRYLGERSLSGAPLGRVLY